MLNKIPCQTKSGKVYSEYVNDVIPQRKDTPPKIKNIPLFVPNSLLVPLDYSPKPPKLKEKVFGLDSTISNDILLDVGKHMFCPKCKNLGLDTSQSKSKRGEI